jgi:hypothetical protein
LGALLRCGVGVRKETFRNRHVDEFLLGHLTCIIELLQKELCECNCVAFPERYWTDMKVQMKGSMIPS